MYQDAEAADEQCKGKGTPIPVPCLTLVTPPHSIVVFVYAIQEAEVEHGKEGEGR